MNMENKETLYIEAGMVKCEEGVVNIYSTRETVKSLAKVEINHNKGTQKLFVRLNPTGLINFTCDKVRRNDSKWLVVSEKCWSQYCKFLRTGNVRFLANAERTLQGETK